MFTNEYELTLDSVQRKLDSTLHLSLHNTNLQGLIEEASRQVLETGFFQDTARGETYSLNNVLLTWEEPSDSPYPQCSWSQIETEYYQQLFVDKNPDNAPETSKIRGQVLFPYTYAARSRYWDGGWGYVVQVIGTLEAISANIEAALSQYSLFEEHLAEASEYVHLQTLLAVWDWLGIDQMREFRDNPKFLKNILARTRIDQLERIIDEIDQNCNSRRAITASFIYPSIDFRMNPLMSMPAYQNFQLLPSLSKMEPLHSLHYHRSLDLKDGVLLDFYHDFQWLAFAAEKLSRPIGSITVMAGNLHIYTSKLSNSANNSEKSSILNWLMHVTDGYIAGSGTGQKLLETTPYKNNVHTVFRKLTGQG